MPGSLATRSGSGRMTRRCLDRRRSRQSVSRGYRSLCFFFQAEDGIRDHCVTGVQTCALPISIVLYALAHFDRLIGDTRGADKISLEAAQVSPDYCFPSRLEELIILRAAIAANPHDARAPYYLGNLLYDRRRYREAISLWEQSARLDPSFSVAGRNLSIGYFTALV